MSEHDTLTEEERIDHAAREVLCVLTSEIAFCTYEQLEAVFTRAREMHVELDPPVFDEPTLL